MTPYVQIPGIDLREELGQGAYSVVYRAMQGATPCAVKVPKSKGRWSPWVYREAVALARVRHPGLPAVLDVGECEGLPYLVTELVEGETLAQFLRRGPLDRSFMFEVAIQLVSTLGAVHDAGLVHRDVKPRNIIVDSGGRVRLVDFGFAAAVERSELAAGAGTPNYAAPEQLRTPSRVDGRTDLYAVGCVLFECLTNSLPVNEPDPAVLAPVVGEDTARIVCGLLAHEPDRRYADVRAVLVDLGRVTNRRPCLGPSALAATRYQPPLVARDREIDRVSRAMRTLDTNRGAFVLVQSERGGGKTAFLETCASKLRSGGRSVIEVVCQDGAAPLTAVRDVLHSFLDGLERTSPRERDELEGTLRAAVRHLEPLAVLIAPRLARLLQAKPEGAPSSEAFLEGAAELFVRLSRRTPFVVVLDDAHWMDRVSRDVLARVVDRLDEAPFGFVVGRRLPATDATSTGFTGLKSARANIIDLPPLADAEIAELIARHLGVESVSPAVVHHVAVLADGTPQGVLEVLGCFLDFGVLRPHARSWKFEAERVDQLHLPDGALALVGRRLQLLPDATRRVLVVAATIGTTFEDALLVRVIGLDVRDVAFALAATRRAGILELVETGRHRFLHDRLRETLIRDLDAGEARRWHQRIAEVLDDGASEPDRLHRAAHHFELGELERAPTRAFAVARAAAAAALLRFDNETALRWLNLARRAATAGTIALDADFHRSVGEAQLRVGALDDSLVSFASALAAARDGMGRATILGRVSWVWQARGDAAKAWSALEEAFEALDVRMPVEKLGTVAHAAGQLARFGLRKVGATKSHGSREQRELLCELHFQNSRLGLENEKPLRVLQSTLEMVELGETLGPSRALARANAIYGFIATALSRGHAGENALTRARAVASEIGDPVVVAFCVQQQAMSAASSGDFSTALACFRQCTEAYAPWIELNEYCINAYGAEWIESIRGRSTRAWPFLLRALERLRRSRQTDGFQLSTLLFRARAALASLGREPDAWVNEQLRAIETNGGPTESHQRKLSWGPRVRVLVETGDVGPEFDALVRGFVAERHKPKTVNPLVADYYVAVVHGRIHQCLASREARPKRDELKAALKDLSAIATVPLLQAHARFAEGCAAFFDGNRAEAQALFGKAEAIATEQTCPWVLYGVARVRAHMLRDLGHTDAARDQARVAQTLAFEHGAASRERLVREEFDLAPMVQGEGGAQSSFASRSSRRARRQLAALLDVLRLPRATVDPKEQANKILDELVRHLDADHALVVFQPRTVIETVRSGRTRRGESWSDPDGWRDALLRAVHTKGDPWPLEHDSAWMDQAPEADASRVVVVPLFLRDAAVGAVMVERAPVTPPFSNDERGLVDVLSHQISIALDLALLLVEHDRVQSSLQHAQKLQAMGQLAGGLAHDFNNMLNAIQGSASLLRDEVTGELLDDVDVILDATRRAAQLTRQLLSFSHQETGRLEACDLGPLVRGLEPMLRRVVGRDVSVITKIDSNVGRVLTDPPSFEQALVNLVRNARDATPDGGTITISVSNVVMDDVVRRAAPELDDAVAIVISDTGKGMTPEIMGRIFEPFFTTKDKRGAGLGLATLYAFVKSCGGHVEVESEVGRGTTFTLFFRAAPIEQQRSVPALPRSSDAPPNSTILVVDDDDSVRQSTRRLLEHHGYQVLDASNADEAYGMVQRYRREIGLLIVDVIMPDTSGPDFARSLRELDTPAKVLFVTGLVPNGRNQRDDLSGHTLLEKPFSAHDLLSRIAALMPAKLAFDRA